MVSQNPPKNTAGFCQPPELGFAEEEKTLQAKNFQLYKKQPLDFPEDLLLTRRLGTEQAEHEIARVRVVGFGVGYAGFVGWL